jgi:hypothetical protein
MNPITACPGDPNTKEASFTVGSGWVCLMSWRNFDEAELISRLANRGEPERLRGRDATTQRAPGQAPEPSGIPGPPPRRVRFSMRNRVPKCRGNATCHDRPCCLLALPAVARDGGGCLVAGALMLAGGGRRPLTNNRQRFFEGNVRPPVRSRMISVNRCAIGA